MLHAPLVECEAAQAEDAATAHRTFELPLFEPRPMPADMPVASFDASSDADRDADRIAGETTSEGIVLHGLLERITQSGHWPAQIPSPETVSHWLQCSHELAAQACERAAAILSQPELERFFNPAHFQAAHNELDVITPAGLGRIDRLVVFDNEVWILDYKRQALASERAAHAAQLAGYRNAARAIYAGRNVRTALVTAEGRLVEIV
jgi:ATP-dependent helicase/nuclease subunit A